MSSFDPIVTLPGLGEMHLGDTLRTGAAVLASLCRRHPRQMAHVFVRGVLRTLLNRETSRARRAS